MGVNAKLDKNDSKLYHSGRDIAHNFKHVAAVVAGRMENAAWEDLEQILLERGTSNEELEAANRSFVNFIVTAVGNPKETMDDVLRRSGWYDCSPEAQVAYMAYLGTVMAGLYFDGVREVTIGGVGPCTDTGELREASVRASEIMLVPKWRRSLARLCRRIKEARGAFRGKRTV